MGLAALGDGDWGRVAVDQYGPVVVPVKMPADWRRKVLHQAIYNHLPKAWVSKIHQRGRMARKGDRWAADRAEGAVYAYWLNKYHGADAADLSEQSIRERADAIAEQAVTEAFNVGYRDGGGDWIVWDAWRRMCAFVEWHGGRIVPTDQIKTLRQWELRVTCPKWWRRVLRRWVSRRYEAGAIELGMVGAQANQWYCSNRAVLRRQEQNAANQAAMMAQKIESATGQQMTVWDAAQLTVSNKAIRRGELMTRIRGCEVWADAAGLVGLFTTNTCPSRFHAHLKNGGPNPNWEGATPSDGQAWLCNTWAKLRAKLQREGVPIFGFRVAEPHHDGCPHWHMLLWCKPEMVGQLEALMVEAWLSDSGNETGAAKHRCTVKKMIAGMASGYVAKYIAKNIDDKAIDSHVDDYAPGQSVAPDMFEDVEIQPCQRVEAWASLWRIRQFQAFGQPSVGVWRELRKVTQESAAAASDNFVRAWLSVHKRGDTKADWAGYMRAQGGAMLARDDYRLCKHAIPKNKVGRYGAYTEQWVCGVRDRASKSALNVTGTKREVWGSEGFASRSPVPPWTRLNNCTRHNGRDVGKVSNEVNLMVESGELDCVGRPEVTEIDTYRAFFSKKMQESGEISRRDA